MDLTLLSALMGGVGDESDYLAKDPFALAGRSVGTWNMPAPKNNSEAWLMPIIQGGLMGALGGYGRSQAQQAQYGDMQSLVQSPLLAGALAQDPELSAMFSGEERPDNFSSKAAKNELLLAALKQTGIDEYERKKQDTADELKAKVDLATNPQILDAEVEKARRIAEASKAKDDSGLVGIPKALQGEAVKEITTRAVKKETDSFIDDQFKTAKDLKQIYGGLKIPFTSIQTATADKLNGISASLQAKAQQILGNEPSDKMRARIDATIPNWTDSDANIEEKKKAYRQLIAGISSPTPILDQLAPSKEEKKTSPKPNAASYPNSPEGQAQFLADKAAWRASTGG